MTATAEVAVRRSQANALPAKIQYAHELAASGLLPAAYRRNPGNVLYAVEYAEMLGLPPMAALTGVHVIDGKPAASAGLISALVRRAGHKLRVRGDGNSATCQIVRADDPDYTFEVTWTLRRNQDGNPSAEEAGLLGKNTWKNYPAAMLKSRAITQAARDACEEALFGLHYTPEELGAETDGDGDVVDAEVVDAAPAGDPWYVHPETVDPAAAEWVTKTLALVPDIGLEACRTLWRETVEKGRSSEVPKPEAEKVLSALKARMEVLAAPQDTPAVPDAEAEAEAEAEPDDGEVLEGEIVTLDADDPWGAAIAEAVDAGQAQRLLDDARDQADRTELDQARLGLIEQALEAAFPGLTTAEVAA